MCFKKYLLSTDNSSCIEIPSSFFNKFNTISSTESISRWLKSDLDANKGFLKKDSTSAVVLLLDPKIISPSINLFLSKPVTYILLFADVNDLSTIPMAPDVCPVIFSSFSNELKELVF